MSGYSNYQSKIEWMDQPRMFWTKAQRAERLLWVIDARKQAAWRIPNRRVRSRVYSRLCRREERVQAAMFRALREQGAERA
ncbi:MAG: hypothetical protein LC772_06885 [Chloroflexi bacterium]|nr:hypothetical protein [Chloroflexota bacterium]